MDGFQRRHHIRADATDIGDFRILTDPDAIIDAAAEMFGKLAVDIAAYLRARLIGVQAAGSVQGFRLNGRSQHKSGPGGEGGQDAFHGQSPSNCLIYGYPLTYFAP